ncbi:MAG: nicotinate (nicotinamide) nucleotide adenylyltransferase [Verrucomicrobia bacterium]|nr:nicotinate (nicotinamide) nucleotide adenylyltransferase [Verrucomicrobiota bacterium]
MSRRIALFGGSFDPFHLGHFLLGRLAWESLRLDEVIYLPCAQSPLKKFQPVAPAADRLRWLKQGLLGQRWAKVSNWEIGRSGISYSIDTAAHWREMAPAAKLFWIMGSDQWSVLPDWKDFRKLARWVHFLVFPRPERPKARRGISMSVLPCRFDVSSTEIRQRVHRRLSIGGLVPARIEGAIEKSRYYR